MPYGPLALVLAGAQGWRQSLPCGQTTGFVTSQLPISTDASILQRLATPSRRVTAQPLLQCISEDDQPCRPTSHETPPPPQSVGRITSRVRRRRREPQPSATRRSSSSYEPRRSQEGAVPIWPHWSSVVPCTKAVAEVVSAKMSRAASDTRLPRGALRQLLWDALRGDESVGADVAAIIKRTQQQRRHLQTDLCHISKGSMPCRRKEPAHVFWKAGQKALKTTTWRLRSRTASTNYLRSACTRARRSVGGCFIDHATSPW